MFSWYSKFAALSRLSKLKWVLFVGLLLVAAAQRFSLLAPPFADHDIRGYLNPAVNFYRFHFFGHANGRNFLYPMFVLLVTRLGGSLNMVTIVQHALGLLTGVLIFGMWQQPFIKAQSTRGLRITATILQLISSGYFLLSTGIIFFEHTIRPESVAVFIMVLLLFLLLKNLGRPNSSALLLGPAFFLSYFMGFFFQRSGLGATVGILFSMYYVARAKISTFTTTLALGVPVLLIAVFVFLPEQYLVDKYDPDTITFGERQFFYSHADIAQGLIKSGFNRQPWITEPELQQISGTLLIQPSTDGHFKHLGFNPDELMYGPAAKSIDSLLGDRTNVFYGFYDGQLVFFGFPKYIVRVFSELAHYYLLNTGYPRIYTYQQAAYYNLYTETQNSLYPEISVAAPLFQNYTNQVARLQNYGLHSYLGGINFFYYLLQLTFLPMLLSFMLAFSGRRYITGSMSTGQLDAFNKLGIACWLLLAFHTGLVLTVAFIHTFGIERYGTSIFPVAILVQTFCGFYLAVAGASAQNSKPGILNP